MKSSKTPIQKINFFVIANRKNKAFSDDLIKDIAGKPLIDYSIDAISKLILKNLYLL